MRGYFDYGRQFQFEIGRLCGSSARVCQQATAYTSKRGEAVGRNRHFNQCKGQLVQPRVWQSMHGSVDRLHLDQL